MAWNKFKPNKFQNLETKKPSWNPGEFPVLLYGAQTRSLQGKEQMIVQTCQRKMERRILKVVWSDEGRMPKEGREPTWRTPWQRLSQVEMGRPCGKNGPTPMGTSCTNAGPRNRQKKNWATEEPMGRHVEEGSTRKVKTNSQKPVRKENIHTTSAKVTSLGIAHLLIKYSISPWLHQDQLILWD